MLYIGIDVGGMSAKAGVVDDSGNILHKRTVKTNSQIEPNEFISLMVDLICELLADKSLKLSDIKGIGLGFPGSIYSQKGIVRYCCNLNLPNVNFVEGLQEKLGKGIQIKIDNDANLAVLAENLFGAAKGASDVIMFTLGTGVGTGFIADGKLIKGNLSAGAEGGHTVLKMDGRECGCGRKGCFEAYASASALIRDTKEAAQKHPDSLLAQMVEKKLDGKTVFEAASKGDKIASKVIDNYLRHVGEGITNFVNVFFPEIVIIGGGLSNQGDELLIPLFEYVNKNLYGREYDAPVVKFVRATLGNDAGIIGAAALFML